MPAKIEHFAGVIRYWDGAAKYGDPYQWVASIRWVDSQTIEIVGITQPPTKEIWLAVKEEARRQGASAVVYTRYKHGVAMVRRKKIQILK